MRIERAPYWYWQLDRWNLLVAALLLAAVVITAATGGSAPAPVSAPTPVPIAPVAPPVPTQPRPTAQPPTISGLADGAQITAGTAMTLTGTAEPGATVRLFADDKQLAEAIAGPDGRWNLPLPPLSAGDYTLKLRAFAADGTPLAESAPVRVTVVAPSPTATVPTPTPPRPTATPSPTIVPLTLPGLTEGSQLPAGLPSEWTGIALPGAKIQIYDGDKLLGETTAGQDGKWRLVLPGLTVGPHSLSARIVAADGTVLAASAPITVMVVPPTATAQPTPAATATATAAPTPTATATMSPTATATATPSPTATATPVPTATLVPGAEAVTLPEGMPLSLSGTAGPNTKLRIYDGETLIGEVVTDADGIWRLTLLPLAPGLHILTARIYDEAGRLISMSTPLYLTIEPAAVAGTPVAAPSPTVVATLKPTATAAPPEITGPKPGAQLPATAPGLLEGKTEPGATIRVYLGDKLIAEIVADAQGTWRVLLPILTEGKQTLTARRILPDGTEQLDGTVLSVTVVPGPAASPVPRTLVAGAPTLSPPADPIRSSQPLLSGMAAPRSTVRIYVGDFLLGETQADGRSRWYFVPPIALAIGKHTLRIAGVGPDGKDATSNVYELEIAAGATGLKPLTFVPSTGKAPSPIGILQGVAPPETLVSVYEGNTLLARMLADAYGRWQHPLPARTAKGQHTYRIVVSTRDGVELYRSELVPVTISFGPPALLPVTATWLASFVQAGRLDWS